MTTPTLIFFSVIVSGMFRTAPLFYALYKKGDVHAVISRGRTIFELDVKERRSERKE